MIMLSNGSDVKPSRGSISSHGGRSEDGHLFIRACYSILFLLLGDVTDVILSWYLTYELIECEPVREHNAGFLGVLSVLNIIKVVLFVLVPVVQYTRRIPLCHISDQGIIYMGVALFTDPNLSVLDLRLCALNFSELHMCWALLTSSTFFFELILVFEYQLHSLYSLLGLDFATLLLMCGTPAYFLGWAATVSIDLDCGQTIEVGLISRPANRACQLAKIARAIQIHNPDKLLSNFAVISFAKEVYQYVGERQHLKRLKKNVIDAFLAELIDNSGSVIIHYIRILNRYASAHRVERLLIPYLPPDLATIVLDYQFR